MTRTFSGHYTVEDIKQYLQNAINELESFDSKAKVNLSTSTFRMSYPLQINNDGYIDIDPMEIERYIE